MRSLAILTLFSLAAAANATAQQVQIHLGMPRDSVLYAELNLDASIKTVLDLKGLGSKGLVGWSYEDISARLRLSKVDVSAATLENIISGTRRVGFSLIDVGLGGANWLLSLDHTNPASAIEILESLAKVPADPVAAKKPRPLFTKTDEIAGSPVYKLEVPYSWFDWESMMFGGRRNIWWGESPKSFHDPIFLSVWNKRFLIIGSRESDVKDSLEFYDFPEDTENSLAGSRAFREAHAAADGADFWLYWNIPGTLNRVERVALAAGQRNEDYEQVVTLLELRQLNYVLLQFRYDSKKGEAVSDVRLRLFNAPTWLQLLPLDGQSSQLANRVPAEAAMFGGANLGSPSELFKKLGAFLKAKGEAAGRPQLGVEFEKAVADAKKELGFSIEEVLELLTGDAAFFGVGADAQSDSVAFAGVFQLTNEARALEFIHDKLAISEDKTLRQIFHHTAERVTVEGQDGRRVGYQVFNASDANSTAWVVTDGCLILGQQRAVAAAIRANLSGKTLGSSDRYKQAMARHQSGGLFTLFSRFEALFGQIIAAPDEEVSTPFDALDQPALPALPPGVDPAVFRTQPDPEPLAKQLAKKFLADYVGASVLRVSPQEIAFRGYGLGLPTGEGIQEVLLRVAAESQWDEANTKLSDTVGKAVLDQLWATGDLPATIEEFVTRGGDPEVFRDPTLAGPAIIRPTAKESFVWLGKHGDKSLANSVPLAHTSGVHPRTSKHLLLMSDGSVHAVHPAQLAATLAIANAGTTPVYRDRTPQTLEAARARLEQTALAGSSSGDSRD